MHSDQYPCGSSHLLQVEHPPPEGSHVPTRRPPQANTRRDPGVQNAVTNLWILKGMKTFLTSWALVTGSCILLSAAEFDIRDEAEFGKVVAANAKVEKLAGD